MLINIINKLDYCQEQFKIKNKKIIIRSVNPLVQWFSEQSIYLYIMAEYDYFLIAISDILYLIIVISASVPINYNEYHINIAIVTFTIGRGALFMKDVRSFYASSLFFLWICVICNNNE